MKKHVIEDAKRCLQCKNPKCTEGCPINTPIKEAIRLFLDGQIEEAGKMLFENNPLSLICSYICPQENQCEGHCVLGNKGSPVHISAIEQYISDFYLSNLKPFASQKNKGKIAVIGSGPAGITVAYLLALKNYNVTIFEGNDYIGGILRYGIPEFRLPKNKLDVITEKLLQTGIKIRPNTTIGLNLTVDDLFKDGYLAVFMGTGVWRPLKLGIKGESLGHVHFAVEYLRNPNVYRLGQTIAIIGAGNVAMDVARTAIRHGVEQVYIICNSDESKIKAKASEVEYAKIDGTMFEFNKAAVEFVDEGVILADSQVYIDENGKEQMRIFNGSEQLFKCDTVIIAVNQGPRSIIVSSTKGIEVNENGFVITDEFGRTSREGLFASGDVVTGSKTVVEAVCASRKVANSMDEYVTGKYNI